MAHAATAASTIVDLSGDPKRHRKEARIRRVFKGAAIFSVVVSSMIVLSLLGRALYFLSNVDLSQLVIPSRGWFPRRGFFDISTIVVGTLVVSGIGMLVAAPLGLGAAIYLSEYAKPRLRRLLKPVLEILAGVPSVVLGFFAITWIGPNLVHAVWPQAGFFNMATAGIAVGVLITPLVASVAEDSFRSVPSSLREASYGMGARKRTTTTMVVLPAAISGVVASMIIALSRAIGETMIVAIAAGASGGSAFEINPIEQGQTMTAAMTALAIGSDRVRGEEGTFESLFFVGLLLFLITLALNIASERFVRRVRKKY